MSGNIVTTAIMRVLPTKESGTSPVIAGLTSTASTLAVNAAMKRRYVRSGGDAKDAACVLMPDNHHAGQTQPSGMHEPFD